MNNSFVRNLLISTILLIVFVVMANDVTNVVGQRILLVSIFLAIPLLLFLVPTTKRDGNESRYHSFLVKYHPYIAFTMGLSLIFPVGSWAAGLLSIPWALYLIALAGYGLRRWIERGWYILEENAIDLGLIYAFIGGIALSVYSFGGKLLGYGDEILFLTATHFHFASIFTPLFIGLVGRLLTGDQLAGKLYRFTAIGMILSPLLVAIGIYTYPIVDTIAVSLYAIFLLIYSYFVLIHISKKAGRFIVRLCLQLSTIVVILTILLAVTFSISSAFGSSWLTIEQMRNYHGVGNAIGFVLLGLLGWVYLKPKEHGVLYGLPQTEINGDKTVGKDFLDRNELTDPKTHHAGLIDNFDKFARNDFFPAQIHPKIRSFYENTMLYDLAAQITWHRGFGLIAKIHQSWSRKKQQLNLPVNNSEIIQLDSKIVAVNNEEQQYWNRNLKGWIRTYRDSDQTMFVSIYSDHNHNNEQYLHITLPIPKRNLAGILRMEHGADLALQLTSLPRRGDTGDEGVYLMTKKLSIRLPINEHFLIWVDDYGRLQATHRIWLFGFKMLSIEYEISGKVR